MLKSVADLYASLGAMVTDLGSTAAGREATDRLMFVRAQAMAVLVTGLGTRELMEMMSWSSLVDTLRYGRCLGCGQGVV